MKKIVKVTLIVLILLLSITACNNSKEYNESQDTVTLELKEQILETPSAEKFIKKVYDDIISSGDATSAVKNKLWEPYLVSHGYNSETFLRDTYEYYNKHGYEFMEYEIKSIEDAESRYLKLPAKLIKARIKYYWDGKLIEEIEDTLIILDDGEWKISLEEYTGTIDLGFKKNRVQFDDISNIKVSLEDIHTSLNKTVVELRFLKSEKEKDNSIISKSKLLLETDEGVYESELPYIRFPRYSKGKYVTATIPAEISPDIKLLKITDAHYGSYKGTEILDFLIYKDGEFLNEQRVRK